MSAQKSPKDSPLAPLAHRLRPTSLANVVGQKHLLASDKPLGTLFAASRIHSMILWGPPGVGKTTIARLLAARIDAKFIAISSVSSGVADIRKAVAEAEAYEGQTIFFIDEIHRFNKSQQDSLLPYVETGLLTLIGATTFNPSFEINSALLSRCQVYVLQVLEDEHLAELTQRALKLSEPKLDLSPQAQERLFAYANGDGRRLLNALEYLLLNYKDSPSKVELADIERLLPGLYRRYDKRGDEFYDQISALHKSVRGSDPDASLYWFCRMIDGGCDPRYLARRIIRMSWEDIGLADPRAIDLALAAADTYERLGTPEGELALANVVLYMAATVKSNASYQAYNQARGFIKGDGNRPVPMHLRNAPTRLMKDLGHGRDYRYAHDYADGFVPGEQYLPKDMPSPNWYQPTDRGLEKKIQQRLQWLSQLNRQESRSRASSSGVEDEVD